jgi:hypothetical protein
MIEPGYKAVRFTRSFAQYNENDIATFGALRAKSLVDGKVAEYLPEPEQKPKAKGAKCQESSPEKVR